MTDGLEPADRTLLDRVQAGVPLVELPFAVLAAELGTTDADVLARLVRLTETRVLRQIGAIFDTRACGYASALVAARVAPGALARAAAVVSAHPGVSHCYERDHDWNLWFTLAVPGTSRLGLARTVETLGVAVGAESIRPLPALRTFKIAARFDLDPGDAASAAAGGWREGGEPPPRPVASTRRRSTDRMLRTRVASASVVAEGAPHPPAAHRPGDAALSDDEIAVVRVLQKPLALVDEPFAAPASDAGMSQTELLTYAKALLDRGVMRRFAGLLNHRHAGFGANVMAAWALPPERVEEAGRRVAGFSAITHCYERPVFADWPYALFSMIHGRTREACAAVVAAVRAAIRPDAAALLWTRREFKKARLMLFTPEYEAWETSVAGRRQ